MHEVQFWQEKKRKTQQLFVLSDSIPGGWYRPEKPHILQVTENSESYQRTSCKIQEEAPYLRQILEPTMKCLLRCEIHSFAFLLHRFRDNSPDWESGKLISIDPSCTMFGVVSLSRFMNGRGCGTHNSVIEQVSAFSFAADAPVATAF